MNAPPIAVLDPELCRRACLARDARFDGLFFTAVKTTGIFCRPVCPAPPPKAANATYFATALAASRAGYRPCLRCRPETAPGSPAWRGVHTTLDRAVRLIDAGDWRDQRIEAFAARLGVSERYLRRLFRERLGIAPLGYANFRRALLARQLLHETALPVPEVAILAGFGSSRRCSVACQRWLGANPRSLRRAVPMPASGLSLLLHYRPPYHWPVLRNFLAARAIPGLERVGVSSYSRSFADSGAQGAFVAVHHPERHAFAVHFRLDRPAPILGLVARVRAVLDLDADPEAIAAALGGHPALAAIRIAGLRLSQLWTPFEAGVRAILGQQVSVAAARGLVTQLVERLGAPRMPAAGTDHLAAEWAAITRLFPEPAAVAAADLGFLRMPARRRAALHALARHLATGGTDDPAGWDGIPGLGPWTRRYATLRLGDPDVFLDTDLAVRKSLARLGQQFPELPPVAAESCRPWGSYATLSLWQALADCGAREEP